MISGGPADRPMLIPRTHNEVMYQLRATAEAMSVGEASTYLAALPVAHNAAPRLPRGVGTILAGGKVVLADSASPDDAFPLIAREGVTLTTLVPSVLDFWVKAAPCFEEDLSGLLIQVGAMLPPDLGRRVGPSLGCRL